MVLLEDSSVTPCPIHNLLYLQRKKYYRVLLIKYILLLQIGYLDVVVPPDFVPEDTSGDVMVPEGGTVKLTCRARGYPPPHVIWRREDSGEIVIKEPSGIKTKGELLKN